MIGWLHIYLKPTKLFEGPLINFIEAKPAMAQRRKNPKLSG